MRLSKNQRVEAAADWLPLARAVFTFGVAADDMAADLHDTFDPLTAAEVAEVGATPFSKGRLTQTLEEKSGATRTEIDSRTLTFSFFFVDNGSRSIGGPPWTILSGDTARLPDPPVEAGAG